MINWSAEPDLARLHRAHQLLKTDAVTALIELSSLAEKGSIMAMIYLGNAYKLGQGTRIDQSQSERWYRRAADAGSMPAYYELGRVYLERKQYEEAKQAFTVAADRGYIPAVHFLGRMFFYGQGVTRDVRKASELLERASAGGSIYARRILGQILLQSRPGLPEKLRGMWLLSSGAVMLTAVLVTQGLASDRLR